MKLLLFTLSLLMTTSNTITTIYNAETTNSLKGWYTLDDDVMGGVSASQVKLERNGNILFEGKVSTANNGGFASLRYSTGNTKVEQASYCDIYLKGDEKDYQFRIKEKKNDRHSFVKAFKTNGEWQTISIKLADMAPRFRGRTVAISNFNGKNFEEIGFLIGNKKNEKFRLEIGSISLR